MYSSGSRDTFSNDRSGNTDSFSRRSGFDESDRSGFGREEMGYNANSGDGMYSSGMKRNGSFSDRSAMGNSGLLGDGVMDKRSRDYAPAAVPPDPRYDPPRYDARGDPVRGGYRGDSFSYQEEERMRRLAELEQLKREHDLALLRRTIDLDRREVEAALRSREDPRYRDRRLDYERRGIHDRDTRRDRIRRSRERYPDLPRRDRPPPRRSISPLRSRSGMRSRSRSRKPSEARSRTSASGSAAAAAPPIQPIIFECEVCQVKFDSEDDKKAHMEKDEKHLQIMDKFTEFALKTEKSMDDIIKSFITARAQKSKGDDDEEEPDKYPGFFFTGERWRVRVYNPDRVLGSDFILPVTGFYCAICEKFYQHETAARQDHCKSREHWDTLRSWLKENGDKYEPLQYSKFAEEKKRANGDFKEEESDDAPMEVKQEMAESADPQNQTEGAQPESHDGVDLDYEENLDDSEQNNPRRNWSNDKRGNQSSSSSSAAAATDQEMLAMFDAVSNILQNPQDEEVDEIPVSVVDDPYNSSAHHNTDNIPNEDSAEDQHGAMDQQEVAEQYEEMEDAAANVDSGLVMEDPLNVRQTRQTATRGRGGVNIRGMAR